MNLIITLIILCAIFYFFKTIVYIALELLSFVWGWIKGLGVLLMIVFVIAYILGWLSKS